MSYSKEERREWYRRRRHTIKRRLVEALGGKCIRCGYSKCLAALEFHHPGGKDLALGGFGRKYETLLEEALKCELLCANCHREIHWNVRG